MNFVGNLRAALLATALLFAALLAGGCAPEEALCLELVASLRRCDLQAADLQCDALSYGEKSALLGDVDAGGCAALRREDGRVREDACAMFGWDCPEALGTPTGFAPASPVLYVSGIDAAPIFDWNTELIAFLQRRGVDARHVALPPWSSAEERATVLGAEVSRAATASPTGRVHLVCWAVGGIDCRYLVSPGGLLAEQPDAQGLMAQAVLSITTLGTPHRGTYVATAALLAADTPGLDTPLTEFLGLDLDEGLERFIEPGLMLDLEGVRAQLHRLQPSEMARFNERVVDADEVSYRSVAGVSYALGQPYAPGREVVARDCGASSDPLVDFARVDFEQGRRDALTELLVTTSAHAGRTLVVDGATRVAASDGMIPVPSARWGVFRGCLPADHYDLVGQLADLGADPSTGFDAKQFHWALAADLALEEPR